MNAVLSKNNCAIVSHSAEKYKVVMSSTSLTSDFHHLQHVCSKLDHRLDFLCLPFAASLPSPPALAVCIRPVDGKACDAHIPTCGRGRRRYLLAPPTWYAPRRSSIVIMSSDVRCLLRLLLPSRWLTKLGYFRHRMHIAGQRCCSASCTRGQSHLAAKAQSIA